MNPDDYIVLVNNPRFSSRYWNYFPQRSLPEHDAIIFVGLGHRGIPVFPLELLYHPQIHNHRYLILLGKGDYDLRSIANMEIPESIIRIYGNNVDFEHERIRFFPMGRDFRSREIFMNSDLALEADSKDILCYVNFSVNTHADRVDIYNDIRGKDFMLFEHMGSNKNYSITRHEFYRKLARSKFVICPRGNALDSFRFYDSLYLGCIPIVVREEMHRHFAHLPILFLDSKEQFRDLTREGLEAEYGRISSSRVSSYPELSLSWWLGRVERDFAENTGGSSPE